MRTKINITKDHCPMTFVKVKLALSKLAEGDVLEVVLSGSEPLENVPKSAQEQGHRVLSITELNGETHSVVIEKGS